MTTNKNHNSPNVPNLRFPEFTGEWKKCTIAELATKVGSGVTPRGGEAVYKTEGHPFVRSQNVGLGHLLLDDIAYIDEDTHQRQKNTELQLDDVLLNITGASIGRSAIVTKEIVRGNVNQHVCIIRTKDNLVSSFLCNFLLSNYGQKQIDSFQAGGNRQGLNFEQIKSIKIGLPSIEEQKKIAELLQLLEQRIVTQNKIIEDLKKLKSAISHILFSSKGAIHLSEIANVVMGQSPSSNAYNDQGLGMPLVQGNLDISNGKTTPRLYTAEFNQTTEKGNIILTVRAPVGEVAKATQKVCLGRGVCAIIPHEENMSDFIYQYLTFYKFMWRRYEQGSTFTSINGSDVRNIFCPKVRNVSILTLLDIKINIEERVVKQYQSQKQYMLYQMFI